MTLIIKKLLHMLFVGPRVFVVTKTMRVVAYTHDEAINKARAEASASYHWSWHVKGETDDLF